METTADKNVIPMTPATADVVTQAREKLEKELKDAKQTGFAKPIIGNLLKRIEESESLAADVVQEHKTWKKCFDYIYSQARKQSKGNCVAVRDEVVYEWAEDYYRKDDKAEEEEKARKEEERKKKATEKKEVAKKETVSQKETTTTDSEEDATENDCKSEKQSKTVATPKKEPKKKDLDGQMDLFSFMAGLGGE